MPALSGKRCDSSTSKNLPSFAPLKPPSKAITLYPLSLAALNAPSAPACHEATWPPPNTKAIVFFAISAPPLSIKVNYKRMVVKGYIKRLSQILNNRLKHCVSQDEKDNFIDNHCIHYFSNNSFCTRRDWYRIISLKPWEV